MKTAISTLSHNHHSKKSNKKIGDWAEKIALDFLSKKNLQIQEQNYFSRYGEIDLICRKGNTLIFIEVRYRNNQSWCHPSETITLAKQQRIIKTSLQYIQQHPNFDNYRFDVIAISGEKNQPNIDWIQNAFS